MRPLFNPPETRDRRRRLRREQTFAEKILWSQLRNRQLGGYKFFRQYGVGPYTLDFYSPTAQLSIELDGPEHAEPQQQKHDKVRTQYLRHFQIRELRFWNDELIENPNRVIAKIAEALGLGDNNPI